MITLRNVPFTKLPVQEILRLIAEEKLWIICLYYSEDVLLCDLEGNLEGEVELIEAQLEQVPILFPEMDIRLFQILLEILPIQEVINLAEKRQLEVVRITIYGSGKLLRYDLEMKVNRSRVDVEDLLERVSVSVTPTPTPIPDKVQKMRLARDSLVPRKIDTNESN